MDEADADKGQWERYITEALLRGRSVAGVEQKTNSLEDIRKSFAQIDVATLSDLCKREGAKVGVMIADAGEETGKLLANEEYGRLTRWFHWSFELLDEASSIAQHPHGLAHWALTKPPTDASPAMRMEIDVVSAAGKSLVKIECSSCNRVIVDSATQHDVRHMCLDCGPERVYQCDDCFTKSPHNGTSPFVGHVLVRESEHYLHQQLQVAGPTVAISLCNALRTFKDRPFLGWRTVKGGRLDDYEWITYGEVSRRAFQLANTLRVLNARFRPANSWTEQHRIAHRHRDFIGICGPNDSTWVTADFACALSGCVSVGLHQTFSAAELSDIVGHIGLCGAVIHDRYVPHFILASEQAPNLRYLIVYGGGAASNARRVEQHWKEQGVKPALLLVHLDEVLAGSTDSTGLADSKGAPSSGETTALAIADMKWTPPARVEKDSTATAVAEVPGKCSACKKAFAAVFGYCNACYNNAKIIAEDHKLAEHRRVAAEAHETRHTEMLQRLQKVAPALPTDLFTLIFTSGTSGRPKQVMETDMKWNSDILVPNPVFPLVQCSYIPLSHSSDRLRVWETAMNGGRVGFCRYTSDGCQTNDLLDDIRQLRPSVLLAPPRVWNNLFSEYQQELVANPQRKNESPDEWQARVLTAYTARALGDRIQAINTGAAPTAPEVLEFLRMWHVLSAGSVSVSEGYGTSELGGVAISVADVDGWSGLSLMRSSVFKMDWNGSMRREMSLPQVKLVSAPELDYHMPGDEAEEADSKTDASDVHYVGELLVNSACATTGYFRDPAATAAAFDGLWYRTGDIVEVNKEQYRNRHEAPQDLTLRIVDRKSNCYKLAMGEKYSPERLEAAYALAPSVSDVAIVALASESFVLAVAIPSRQVLSDHGVPDLAPVKEMKTTSERIAAVSGLDGVEAVRKQIMAELSEIGRQHSLLEFEVPHAVIVDVVDWHTMGVRNSAQKMVRRRLAKEYADAINATYSQLRTQPLATPQK